MKKSLLVLALLALAAVLLVGCGGGGGGNNGGGGGGNTGTVTLASPTTNLTVGQTAQLTVKNSSGTAVTLPSSTFTFTSSNPAAATVSTNGGLVTAVAATTTPVTITATEASTNKTGTVQIAISAPGMVTNAPTLTASTATAAVGAGIPLTVTNGSGGSVTLPSSNFVFASSTNVITVSTAGVASAAVPVTGTVTVTDTSTGKTSAPVTVTFKAALSARTILITRGTTGARDIYALNVDTLTVTRLTNSAGGDGDNVNASPSADGTSITFASNRGANYEIYTADSDGTNVKKITSNGAVNETPRFSPDGTKILYSSSAGKTGGLDGNGRDLYVIPVAGGAASRLTTTVDGIVVTDPAYSADGTQIAYSGYTASGTTGDIYRGTLNSAGTAFAVTPTKLTTAAFNRWPAFSPAGDKIAYTSNESGLQQIDRINPDGTGKQVVTSDPVLANKPAYLADGTLVYVSGQNGSLQIYSTNPGSGTSVQLTKTNANDDYPHARLK